MLKHPNPFPHLPSTQPYPKHAAEDRMMDADRAFFAANPHRKFYVRWAGELEEMAFRKLWKTPATEPGRAFVVVQQIVPGARSRHPHFIQHPDTDRIHLPTSEHACAALMGCSKFTITFGAKKPTIYGE